MADGTQMSDMAEMMEQLAYAAENAPDCPSCETSSDTHVVRQGSEAHRGDGIYCGLCDAFVSALPDITS